MSAQLQEILALTIVALAALYLVHKLVGLPGRRRAVAPAPPPVQLGGRLARGLEQVRARGHVDQGSGSGGCHD